MDIIESQEVLKLLNSYPPSIRNKLLNLRQLILDTAWEMELAGQLEETFKWGEPSYVSKNGSTIRIDWKPSTPHQYAMYFHCKTRLIDTFRELYQDIFEFDGNRAIIFNKQDHIPISAVKHCISMALCYHSIKHLPMLGA